VLRDFYPSSADDISTARKIPRNQLSELLRRGRERFRTLSGKLIPDLLSTQDLTQRFVQTPYHLTRRTRCQGSRREAFCNAKRHAAKQGWINPHAGDGAQGRIAVGGRATHLLGADITSRTGAILDQEKLPYLRAELRGEHPRRCRIAGRCTA
jgi:hypothetical protein